MSTSDSFNQYLDRAVKHYASLFTLPSYRKSLAFSAIVCLTMGLLYTFIFYRSVTGLIGGLILGIALFAISVLLNYLLRLCIFAKDPVYDLRRTAALSLSCWVLWLPFVLIGSVAAVLFNVLWAVKLCLLGFSAVLIFRLIVLYVTSSSGTMRFLAASIIPLLVFLAPFTFLWLDVTSLFGVFVFLLCAFCTAFISSFLFIVLLNDVGNKAVGFPSLSIFRAFLLNWIADLNAPFEGFLEKLGVERSVDISILRFNRGDHNIFVIVPSVHPGPFKNIGSSLLPSMLKGDVERELDGVACVPLGLLGHDYDLTSQAESQKIVEYVVKLAAAVKADEGKATRFVKVQNGLATVCCQIFGETAFMTFSLAPKTTEDLPPELGFILQGKAEKLGLKNCVFVNAHNSIDGAVDLKDALEALESAAALCLEKAASLDKLSFIVGAATVKPKEYGLSDGMGLGGITVVAVEVGGQKTAYVVFDGNNMISGLREKILSALASMGFHDGEILTTDTHSVNAVTLNARGYHPVGEVMNHEKLIDYVSETARLALASLSPAKVGFCCIKVPKVKVIGREALEKLCVLTDVVIQRAKKVAALLFPATFLLLMLVLLWV
ncbi:MAG: DUF2070 family protein [Candidatus Bathyarchaeia archaeon]